MENILYFSSILLLLFLFQLCSPSLASSDYQTPTKYFVNCGSNSDVDFNGQNFVRDTFSIGRSKTIKDKNPSPNTSPLYQAARILKRPFAYEFKITENGTHFVRLHFFVFKSGNTNLADAVFNVSTSTKSLLLSNFSLRNGTNSPVVKEFLLTINGSSKFSIYFIPQGTFFAFVNAIEVFSVPNITRDVATLVTRDGKAADFSGLLSHALHTVHRIDFGGGQPFNESEIPRRSWIPDDDYLYAAGLVQNYSSLSAKLDYDSGEEGNKQIAPELVYKTCKKLEDTSTIKIVTWRFNVSINATYLVRVHFCDTVGPSKNVITEFRLQIGSKFTYKA
uniref:Malectin-like domain-containing protein n=1 Tax=Ficus carica TaxID=3494 RepID=A0AA88D523_FICCA|nr:hypothetical protein TIFTF001_051549 [Ficus carica]GMN27339.1 hypothetical protein TIFTF001_051589 [Ficus carica]